MKYLSDYTNQPLSELYKKHGIIIAFSQDQINEQRKTGIEYIPIGGGMYAPKGSESVFIDELDELYYNAICQDVAENGTVNIIKREFANYETAYTGDKTDLMEYLSKYIQLFPELFDPIFVHHVINECFKAEKS
jgi:hypothetical protein